MFKESLPRQDEHRRFYTENVDADVIDTADSEKRTRFRRPRVRPAISINLT